MGSVILITGGSGFLGQHLIRVLQERGTGIKEIRVLDKALYEDKFGSPKNIPVTTYLGDITKIDDKCWQAFKGVDSVLHCAALVSYQFPSSYTELHQVNVEGTRNVIDLCLECQVRHLIYTSSAEVSVKPYFRNAFFSVMINETESTGVSPGTREDLVFGQYAWTKYQAEKLVLAANRSKHKSGSSFLLTLSLRPPIMYGEFDKGFILSLMNMGWQLSNTLPRLGGPGGKHQFCYAGNVAWAHLCALNTLKDQHQAIDGLPIYITDDTYVYDQLRFCSKISIGGNKRPTLNVSWWYIPSFICFLLAMVYEELYKVATKYYSLPKNPISPKALVTYLGSVIVISRLRATISLNYRPIYGALEAMERSRGYYSRHYFSHQKLKNCK